MTRPGALKGKWRLAAVLVAGAVVVVLVAANAHLVWVALKSQPDCVPHSRSADSDDYRAARSAC